MTVRVVGLGQHVAGDDGAGLCVIDELDRRNNHELRLTRLRDASLLVELPVDDDPWLIVDAVVAGERNVGRVLTLHPDELDELANSSVSSHGMSVGQALALARALNPRQHTSQPRLIAIGIRRPTHYEVGLSEVVKRAVVAAADHIEHLAREESSHA